jgi:multidrug efflux system membrane fusion protein
MMNLKVSLRIICFVFGILLLTSCSKQEPPKSKAGQIPKVTITQPKTEKMERIITAVGTLDPEDEVQVATEVSGLIQEIKFEEGQEVKQGATLVILDPTNFKLNVENARASLKRAKAGLTLAESTYERKKSLYEKKFITDQELQEFATALDKAKAELTGAQATCKIAEKTLEDSVIKAPIDKNNGNYVWEVQKKLVSIGEYVNPGKPVTELVNRITLKLRFTVPEQEAGYLAMDKKVTFTVPAMPNKEFEAKILYIGPKAVEGTRAVIVKARFDNMERVLRSGYSANVRFIAETKEKALIISRRSLRFDVDKTYVWVVDDGALHRKDVSIGVEEADKIEIISGISQTDTIVVRSGSFLEDGTKVEIVEEK